MKVTTWTEDLVSQASKASESSLVTLAANKLSDYLQLVKFKLSALVTITTALGYLIALRNPLLSVSVNFVLTLLGAFLVVGAANAFNQILERETDALMERTKNRPLPSERMSVSEALTSALTMMLLGLTILYFFANFKTAFLAAMALAIYVLAYTPLKRKSEFCILIGAISGAIPPMMGWVAVRNELSQEAFSLFALQFLWQFPHFWAIAWMYRDDYRKIGLRILPAKGEPAFVARQTVLYAIATVIASAYPLVAGKATLVYGLGIFALGVWLIVSAICFHQNPTNKSARNLLCVADSYLPLVLLLWLLTKQI
ncbi:MAG: heme o synthase [Armatimonadetes bacterium]|nr:heme o synthase [Armatimonadota bacterium]MDW8028667.1 heme o synthase [Armatimonadota bacterium]